MTRRTLAFAAVGVLSLTGCAGSAGAPAGTAPDTSVAASSGPEGSVWVANEGASSLSVLDARTGEVVATLTGLAEPHNVQAGTAKDVVWATGAGGVVAIDAHGLFPTAASPAGDHPAHVVESATGDVFVSASGDGVLHRFSGSLRRPRTIDVGGAPHGMRLSADGSLAAAANTGAGTVDLVHLGGGRPHVESVQVGPSPVQVAVSEDGSTVYASVGGSREVVRVDVATARVTGRARVPSSPAQIWLTRSGLVLSADQGTDRDPGNTLSILDADTMTLVARVETGSGPHGVTVAPDESRAWVTNAYGGTVTVVDLVRREVVDTVDVGAYPNGITFSSVVPEETDPERMQMVLPPAYSESGEHSHGTPPQQAAQDDHGDGGHEADGHGH